MLKNLLKKFINLFKKEELPKIDQNIIIISHDDVDGIISSAIIKRKFKEGYYIPSTPRNIVYSLSKLKVSNKKIFITDLSPNEDQIKEIVKNLERLNKDKNEIIWIDHHEWSDNMLTLSNYAKIYIAKTVSAAENVAKVLEFNDEVVNELVKIANDADSATYSLNESKNINRAIRNKRHLQYVLEALTEGRINDEKILKWAKREENKDKMILDIVKTLPVYRTKKGKSYTIIDVRKYKVAGSLLGKYASIEKNLDFTIVIYPYGNVSFYAGINKEINLLPIARKYNGGGHPFACGCAPEFSLKSKILWKISKSYIPKEIKKVIEDINEML